MKSDQGGQSRGGHQVMDQFQVKTTDILKKHLLHYDLIDNDNNEDNHNRNDK